VSSMNDGANPLLRAHGLSKYFPLESGILASLRGAQAAVKAVESVSLDVYAGQTLAIVGESGSGKSTLGRLLLRLMQPSAGQVQYKGENIFAMNRTRLRAFRRQAQIILQDPYASLNPRMRVGRIIREPLDIYREGSVAEREKRVQELLERVGLTSAQARSYPAELSGGQRQRVCIAAALALSPEIIIADEPTSSLDVSVQAQTLNLLSELQRDFNLTYVFITHDLGVVQHFSDRVAVMYLGKIVEEAPTATLFAAPQHPYTQVLFSAIPLPDPSRQINWELPTGEPPSPLDPPSGCHFHPRCPKVMAECSATVPKLQSTAPDRRVACLLYEDRKHSPPSAPSKVRTPSSNMDGGETS